MSLRMSKTWTRYRFHENSFMLFASKGPDPSRVPIPPDCCIKIAEKSGDGLAFQPHGTGRFRSQGLLVRSVRDAMEITKTHKKSNFPLESHHYSISAPFDHS